MENEDQYAKYQISTAKQIERENMIIKTTANSTIQECIHEMD